MSTHPGKILFQQENIRRAWEAEFKAQKILSAEESLKVIEELLLLCNEYLISPADEIAENTSRVAYNIARSALDRVGHARILSVVRDGLIHAILRSVALDIRSISRLIKFINIVSDGCWQAYADKLKQDMRIHTRNQLENDLKLAKRIQQHLLPKSIPQIPGYEFAGDLLQAEEVGGDYWSIKYYPQDDVVTLKLADISGHGISAATLVSAVKFISGGYYPMASSAAWVMERTNHVLVKETPSDILVTMVYFWLHPNERRIDVVNAGHSPVFLLRHGVFHDIRPTGPLLGLSEAEYGEIHMDLQKDDLIFVCSDGITEARRDEQFGEARLKKLVADMAHLPAPEIINQIINAVIQYAGKPADDISVVVVKVL